MNCIKQLRETRHLSQTEFAAKIGVTQQAVANWEAGLTDPTWAKAPLIADLLEVTIDALYGRESPGAGQSAAAS